MSDTPDTVELPVGPPNAMLPGVAALLLQRGCAPERLDDALQELGHTTLPTTLREAVAHVDAAIAQLDARTIETTASDE